MIYIKEEGRMDRQGRKLTRVLYDITYVTHAHAHEHYVHRNVFNMTFPMLSI